MDIERALSNQEFVKLCQLWLHKEVVRSTIEKLENPDPPEVKVHSIRISEKNNEQNVGNTS